MSVTLAFSVATLGNVSVFKLIYYFFSCFSLEFYKSEVIKNSLVSYFNMEKLPFKS